MKSNRSVTPLSVLCGQKPLFHVMSLNHLKACLVFVLALLPATLAAIDLKGKVIDRETGEPLTGATLSLPQVGRSAVSDAEGLFHFCGLGQRSYTLNVNLLGYQKQSLTVRPAQTDTLLLIYMESSTGDLGTAVVSVTKKRNTEVAAVAQQQQSLVVQSGIAGAQIRRTQDKDAGEGIRRTGQRQVQRKTQREGQRGDEGVGELHGRASFIQSPAQWKKPPSRR